MTGCQVSQQRPLYLSRPRHKNGMVEKEDSFWYVVDMTLESGGLRFPIGNMLAKRRRRRGCLEAHNNSKPSVQAVVCQFWPPILKGIEFNLGKRILSAPSLSSSSSSSSHHPPQVFHSTLSPDN